MKDLIVGLVFIAFAGFIARPAYKTPNNLQIKKRIIIKEVIVNKDTITLH